MLKNVLLYISILIIIHHYKKHNYDKKKSFYDKIFQINDINNHETWALFFFGIWVGIQLSLV